MANQQQLPPNVIKYGIFAFLIIFLFTILSNTTFLTIQPGKRGVEFKRFSGGLDKDNIYEPGFHIIAPWNKNKIGYLHEEIGTEYVKTILMPEIRSATREVIGQYLPEELYSTKREAIQDEIFKQTEAAITPKHLILDAVLIRSVKLPEKLEEAIEQKLKEEQLSLQYTYKLDRERQEAERRIIEAQAKADANKILNASLTAKILQDKGIEATLELAKSPNTKTVIVGGGDGGLPLILNN